MIDLNTLHTALLDASSRYSKSLADREKAMKNHDIAFTSLALTNELDYRQYKALHDLREVLVERYIHNFKQAYWGVNYRE